MILARKTCLAADMEGSKDRWLVTPHDSPIQELGSAPGVTGEPVTPLQLKFTSPCTNYLLDRDIE
jgi:hypothetical protein